VAEAETTVLVEPVSAEQAAILARTAQDRSDWESARRHWREARQLSPNSPALWAAETAMLVILSRLDDANALARESYAKFPENLDVASQYLNVLMVQENWLQAATLWPSIAERFSGHAYIESKTEDLTRRMAEGLVGTAASRLRQQAEDAERNRDWETACVAWRALHERHPDDRAIIIGYGRALRETGQSEVADNVLGAAVAAQPEDVELAANHAEVAATRQDWIEAARRWQKLLRNFPNVPALWTMASIAYREAGLYESAEKILARAIAAEPQRVDLRVHHATLAEKQEDWPAALTRWNIALELEPDDLNIRNSRGDVLWRINGARLETGESAPPEYSNANVADDAAGLKRLALRFESLGDACDFGIAQRRLGAEPIGLFRFGAISPDNLIALMEERFDRLGDPAFTELSVAGGDEYMVRDTRGLYHMHSFTRANTVDAEKFLNQQVKRLGYLKSKLMEDLEAANKIFVYKSSHRRITDETVFRIHAALQLFGPNMLLAIRKTEAGYPPGSVLALRPGVLVGYVNTDYDATEITVDLPSWRMVLQNASPYKAES